MSGRQTLCPAQWLLYDWSSDTVLRSGCYMSGRQTLCPAQWLLYEWSSDTVSCAVVVV